MGTEISLFSKKSFIEASKKFVCVRLGTYESKKHQDMIRSLLHGKMMNTAFVVFAPDGKTKLSRSGRSPDHAFGEDVLGGMDEIANNYKPKNSQGEAILTDFHSFKQSLNVSSADQRLLVWSVASQTQQAKVHSTLQTVFNDADVSGKYFYDIAQKGDEKWADLVDSETIKSGIFIIRPGQWGTSGTVMQELPLNSNKEAIKVALTKANTEYAQTEKRKVYNEHVEAGRKEGIDYHNTVESGEDRDGDGKIDPKPERGDRPERRERRPTFK
jgi:hypothetical protein